MTGTIIAAAVGVVAISVVAFVLLYAPGPTPYTLTTDSLAIRDRFYPVTVNAADVDVERMRVVDFEMEPGWRPTMRTNGFGTRHYHSGWFRLANGKKVRMYRADGRRLVLLPARGGAPEVLLEVSDPDQFVREVRSKWSANSGS